MMAKLAYDPARTGLLFVDPYNDFLSDGGKLWPRVKELTEHPKVADAASELLRDVLGDQTVSSRLVFGVASLPRGSPVELEVILEVKA